MSLSVSDRINTKEQLNDWLEYELSKYHDSGIKGMIANSESYVLRKHQILLRKTEYYTNTNNWFFSLIYRVLLSRLQNKYSLHIPINCCGRGLRIMHLGPILMNSNITVGRDCIFHIFTSLVAGGTNDFTPVLGNRVIMGIGATVLGDVHIADDVAIGAHALVTKDVLEEDITVAGVPAVKVSSYGRSAWTAENRQINNEKIRKKRRLEYK